MGDLQQFDTLLETTIKAPRLSGTKVAQLADLSQKLIAQDHHIITTFFKLNASLPHCSQARISSLYVFDSIARACRNAVNKGIGRDARNERGRGTQAGMLLKLEGVVDSWVDGMIDDGKGGVWAEGKEKTRKIIDIWSKHGTFPEPCLVRLSSKIANAGPQAGPSTAPSLARQISGQEQGQNHGQGSTTPPHPPPSDSSQTAAGLPPEIAKLLGIAAQGQTQASSSDGIASQIVGVASPSGNPTSSSQGTGTAPLDIAAILASVTKVIPAPSQAQQSYPQNLQPTTNALPAHSSSSTVSSIPTLDLANLANLIKQAPSPPVQNGQSFVPPQPPVSGGQPPGPPPGLNNNQMAALAKFAALAHAGPAPMSGPIGGPHPQYPPSRPQPPAFSPPARSNARFSPAKVNQGLPSPEITAEPMRLPGHQRRTSREFGGGERRGNPFNGSGQGPGSGPGPVPGTYELRRDGDGQGSGYGSRDGYEGRRGGHRGGSQDGGRGQRGGYEGQRGGGYGPRRDRERSRSPSSRDFGTGLGGGGRGRGGRPIDGGWGERPARGYQVRSGGFNNNNNSSSNSGPPSFSSQNSGPSFTPAPPPPVKQEGRAPPPSWMMESNNDGGEGEADMTLDDSDDNDEPVPSRKIESTNPHHQPQQSLQPSTQGQPQPFANTPTPNPNPMNNNNENGNVHAATTTTTTTTLADFDISSFDPTSPDSWHKLGMAWKNTTGKEPDQVALIHFLATGMVMDPSAMAMAGDQAQHGQSSEKQHPFTSTSTSSSSSGMHLDSTLHHQCKVWPGLVGLSGANEENISAFSSSQVLE
ncbi:hypothetical protein IAR55_002956 [Kwoniella newhampshirensis]|uniref:CID domain-containing protein n=1 Tax=Kwoniella newhampshirensis TaxID=1651941 RepID=A0AAW0YPD4_9TREE